jgi:PAS domain S-box-containing protein
MFLWWGRELIQFYNDAYLPSFGKGKHPAAMGQRGADCWQEIWPIIWPQIDDVMSRAQPSWNEDQLVPIYRNGRLEEVYWTYGYSPVFDESGAVGGTLVVCTETTNRVLSERRLRTMRALTEKTAFAVDLKAMLHIAAQVFAAAGRDIPFALLFTVNASADRVQLVETAGLAAEQGMQLLDPDLRRELGSMLTPAGSCGRGPISLQSPLQLSPGSEPVTQVFVAPIARAPSQVASGFIVFGISPSLPFDDPYRSHLSELAEHLGLAQARIEAFRIRALVESERNNLLLQSPVGTALLIGPQHIFQLANPLYCQLVGRSESELVGKTYGQAFPELAGTPLPEILDRVYQSGTPFVASEYEVPIDRRGDGVLDDCVVKFSLEPLRDVGGEVYGMMAIAVDITEQVRARQVIEKAHNERVKLLEDLEAASRAKDEFLAMLGHELRNPLAPIVTALALMKLRSGNQAGREQQIIERQVSHLIRLVDDLLDVSKITRGKVILKKESVPLAEVLAKAVEMASFLFEQRSHQLVIDAPSETVRWEGDPVRLAQVVANLLTNAARYTAVGGSIRLSAYREGSELLIAVKDNGMGIPKEMLPRIFDLFVQGKRSADRAEGGLGLGLTLVKTLVALHGGTVEAHSEGVGRGSEFIVRLPAATPESAAGAVPPPELPLPPLPPAAHPQRVLVVDDNADAAELLGEALLALGHEVRIANDPLAALTLLAQFRPAVAVLDIGLPVMDGYELAQRIRERPEASGCRLIAVTGYGQEHDRLRSEQAGFETHLVKPIHIEQLVQLIATPLAPTPESLAAAN